ncbi:ABC transporter permease [Streptomyces sp. NPDC005573]|uniref:ABC transporter permease n=1 Tax=Streptomyces sp. NPDC005573 TaxID=3156890 RepID=UPI00339FFF07
MTGFVVSRARAHRLLLGAALLTVVLTTAVLATFTAYSGALGDAALRHVLGEPRYAADTALIVKADTQPAGERAAADAAVREGARKTFDGLPVTVRTLRRSGPYALPRSLRPAGHRSDDPELTHFAALDLGQVRLTAGRFPATAPGDVEAALPETAARALRLKPGARLTLADRLGGRPVRVRITGLYRPVTVTAPYWKLDDLLGRGVKEVGFTTYGPLLAAPATVTGGRVSGGPQAWLASADFSTVTTGRIGALREAAAEGSVALRTSGPPGTTMSVTSLPDVLDRIERSLLVSRSTLTVVALQLVLLAGYALLLVARLLAAERAAETALLRARGASRARIVGLAATEALLLAVPAALVAPLLAGPLTTLLAGHGPLARIGLRLAVPAAGGPAVWLTAAGVALGCALTATLPAPGGAKGTRTRAAGARRTARSLLRPGRAASAGPARTRTRRDLLPSAGRAGADLGLLVVAGVAYWQLDRQSTGAVSADRSGALGIDPLLVAAPALALLAGTVLTLRLLPPVARLAERWAAAGRGLPAALAGWQFSRRTARGAGPVLLLVLAVALGMLAVGQAASWKGSQNDQADFRAGVPVRVTDGGTGGPGRSDLYATVPGVREAAPAVRTGQSLSGDRTATALALDTGHVADALLIRGDLTDVPAPKLLAGLASGGAAAGTAVPSGTAELRLSAVLRDSVPSGTAPDVTVSFEDRFGVPFQLPADRLVPDGRPHTLTVALPSPLGRVTLTGFKLYLSQPHGSGEEHRLTLRELTAVTAGGQARRLALPVRWKTAVDTDGNGFPGPRTSPTRPKAATGTTPSFTYRTGYIPGDDRWSAASLTYRFQVPQPVPHEVAAVATDRYLDSVGAHTGQRVEVVFGGQNLPVRLVRSVRALPTTVDPALSGDHDGGAVLFDLRAANQVLQARYGEGAAPTEWWLDTAPGRAAAVAASLRALPDVDPGQVVVRDEIAAELRDDPFGAGPTAAFTAAAVVAAVLAAVGFAVGAAGSLRAREAEFAVLRALGAPRRRLARSIAAEQAVLVGLALAVGVALGAVLARSVLPLIVLTGEATRPVPELVVRLPYGQVAVLLVAVAVPPLAVTAVLSARRANPARSLREQGGE